MAKIIFITNKQRDDLTGRKYDENSYFNPTQDKNGNWVISAEEAAAYKFGQEFAFIKTEPQADFVKPDGLDPK